MVFSAKYIYASAYGVATKEIDLEGLHGLTLMGLLPATIEPMISMVAAERIIVAEIYLRLTCATVYYGNTYGTLPTPTRDYYTFDGWYTSASGGSKVSSATTMGTGNVAIYAPWTLNPVSDWVLESQVPAGAQVVEERWKYDKTTSYWGSWSSWSATAVYASSTRKVNTKIVTDKAAYTTYRYWRYVNSAGTYAGTYGYNGCTIYQKINLDYALEFKSNSSGVALYGSYVYNGNTYLKNI